MKTQRNEPHAQATAKWSNRGHWIHTVFDCPYCDETHRHKGGTNEAYPDFGSRHIAPCCRGAYTVVEVMQ